MRRMRSFRRSSFRSISTLAAVKTSLEVLSKFSSAAPFLQATVDTALQIIQYAQVSVQLTWTYAIVLTLLDIVIGRQTKSQGFPGVGALRCRGRGSALEGYKRRVGARSGRTVQGRRKRLSKVSDTIE